MPDEPGVSATKDRYPNGTLKLLTRRRITDGLLLAKWHYATNGAITQVEDYDPNGLYVMRTLFKWEDGSSVEYWFDEQHRLWRETREDPPASPLAAVQTRTTSVFLLQGRVTLNPGDAWWGWTHKLNDSEDTITFNAWRTNAVVSVTARDLAHPTNRAAFGRLTTSAQHEATATARMAGWSIYALGERPREMQGELEDGFLDNAESIGVHVRLTISAPPTMTKDQRDYIEAEFKRFLKTIQARQHK
jgi:hypothetical protein